MQSLKEKLKATLSEPPPPSASENKFRPYGGSGSSERGRKSTEEEIFLDEKSSRTQEEKRTNWMRDKFKNNTINSSPTVKVNGNFMEFEPDGNNLEKEGYEERGSNKALERGTQNNYESLNFRNKWRHRGILSAGRRKSSVARLPSSISESVFEDSPKGTVESDKYCNEEGGGVRRSRRSILNQSRNQSPTSISSESEKFYLRSFTPSLCDTDTYHPPPLASRSHLLHEECGSSQPPSALLSQSHSSSIPNRKQSIFYASYGVWSEESVIGSFSELSHEVSSVLEAAWTGQVSLLDKLISKGTNEKEVNELINARDTKGRTPLHLAAASGHVGAVDLLLQRGAEVDPCDTYEKATPLMCAAASGSLPSVQLLLNAGANVNSGFDFGKTSLHWAVQSGSYECAKRLLEAGAKQNPPLVYSENPLHVAASTGDDECLMLLIHHGADPSLCKGSNRSTALHIAAEEGNANCIRVLIKAGANIEAKNARGQTALHVGATVDAECTSVLIEAGADPNSKDRDGRTPLHCAINRGSRAAECLRILVDTNADINVQDNFGYTPLHLAAVNETSQCVSILLQNGADVTIKTKAGTTALALLVRRIPDVMRFLVERLDEAITIHDHEPGDPDCEIRLDFRAVVPNSERIFKGSSKVPERSYYHKPRKETDFLTCVLAAGNKKIMSHPLSEVFLTLKWQRVRKFFWASLLFQIALVLLFTVYVVDVYLIKCPARGIPIKTDPNSPLFTTSSINLQLNSTPPPLNNLKNDSILLNSLNSENYEPPPDDNEPVFNNTEDDLELELESLLENSTSDKNSAKSRQRRYANFNVFSFNPVRNPKNKKMGRGGGGSEREKKRGKTKGEKKLEKNSRFGESDSFKKSGIESRVFINSPRVPSSSNSDYEERDESESETNYYNNRDEVKYVLQCHSPESWLTVVWCLLLVFTGSMGLKECFQFLQAPTSYVLSSENWGQWALIGSVLVAAWPDTLPYPEREPWQYPAAAFGMFLAWGLMLLQVGRFPALGLYVQMLGKVAQNFGLVILGYACLLIAFALAFCVIFPGEPAYFSVPLAILKVLTMMVGEDYESLFYDPEEPLLYPITAHILHGAFVIIITIVLMNLLVGLAVSDIQGLQKGAKLNRLSRQTALISRLESFIFSKKLQAILPTSIGLILQRSALLVPSSYNWSYYFRPNDPRDKRLSKELKLASLRVASSRHSSRHPPHKSQINSHEPNKQSMMLSNYNTENSLRKLEEKLDGLQTQIGNLLAICTQQTEEIRSLRNMREINC